MKTTKLFCVRKGNLYIAWDGKAMVEKPHEGIRVSKTLAERKYSGYEKIPFAEAYKEWHQSRYGARATADGSPIPLNT